ncbi:MAG: alkaline phosphatase [Clostridia bacterium]|nr:alkaline phosphatase [Clostridia bacterium]
MMRQTYVKPKNVIVMIADGMGPNDIIITEKYSEECFGFGLLLNQFKNHGKAITNNDNGGVTDSAASATALATGVKTSNEKVGMTRDGIVLKNVSEIAREQGKKVGIVTNDQITGATPSGYTVHAHSRESTDILANSFVDFAPDVLIGQNFANFIINLDAERQDKFKNNFLTATTIPLMATVLDRDLTGEKPLIGFFNSDLLGDANNMLAQCTEIALNRLDNEKGFFLMIEGAGTDKAGHQNDIFAKMSNVITFERAIAVVLKFMKNNPDTLLLITSDHECGGVQLPAKGEELTDALFTSTSHTSKNVRVFALGYGTEYFRGKTVDNTDIGKFTISAVKGELS